MKVKIIYIISTLETSGPTNILYHIVQNINKDIFEPIIITLSDEPVKSRKQDFLNLRIIVISLQLNRLKGFLFGGKKLLQLIQDLEPGIIHTHSYRADVLAASYLKNYPRVSTLHSNLIDNYSDTYGRALGFLIAQHQINALKRLNLVIACSKTLFHFYSTTFKNSTFVQNGVDYEILTPRVEIDKHQLRKKLNLPLEKLVYICVGSLIERKNPTLIINAFQESERNHDSLLLVAGDGPLRTVCQELAKCNQAIIFLGQIPNVKEYLNAADFYISASNSEGLPTSVLEALSCSLPVILSDINPHKEILELNPEAGFLFKQGNTTELKELISQVKDYPYKQKSNAALQIISESLNARNMTIQYEGIYNGLLSGQ